MGQQPSQQYNPSLVEIPSRGGCSGGGDCGANDSCGAMAFPADSPPDPRLGQFIHQAQYTEGLRTVGSFLHQAQYTEELRTVGSFSTRPSTRRGCGR